GTLEGSAGCNNYFGSYTVSNLDLTISDNLGATQMYCDQATMAQESLYFRLLLSVHSYQITNGKLELVYGSGNAPNLLTYVSGPHAAPPIATQLPAEALDTTWTLSNLDGNNPAGQEVSLGNLTIKFEADGTFYIYDGCNTYSGTYTVSGDQLTLHGPLASTMKACPEVDPTVETKFLQLLGAVKSYALANGQLSLDYQTTGNSLRVF